MGKDCNKQINVLSLVKCSVAYYNTTLKIKSTYHLRFSLLRRNSFLLSALWVLLITSCDHYLTMLVESALREMVDLQ